MNLLLLLLKLPCHTRTGLPLLPFPLKTHRHLILSPSLHDSPKRLIDSPEPLNTETAVASPTPSVIEIPAPEPIDKNHPGEGWQPNICREGIAYPMQILDKDGAITIAPYLRLDLNGGNLHIEGTLGLGCSVTSHPLHATPDRYPHIMLTDRQLQYFKVGEAQMALANRALRDEQDISLQAEVYCYYEGV